MAVIHPDGSTSSLEVDANRAFIELKSQLQAGEPRSEIDKTVKKIDLIICAGGASLVYAGYPYDPFEEYP